MTRWARRLVVTAVAALFIAPGVFVVHRALDLGASAPEIVGELVAPAWRSAQLALLVSATCGFVGTGLAWLVVCTDLPAPRLWRTLLVLPLALPSFVGATAILAGFSTGGVLRGVWELVGAEPPRRIRGLLPAWLLLSAFSYPFVFMPVVARLRALRPSLEESARLLGSRPWSTFWRVTLPEIRAAIVGGMLIVGLYMLSEFGAVQLLGFDTLTRVIYATRQVDRATSFMAAAILFIASIALVALVRAMQGEVGVDDRANLRTRRPTPLGRWKPVALLACLVPITIGVAAPISSLAVAAWRGIGDDRLRLEGLGDATRNTVSVSVIAAVVAAAVVAPVAVSAVRHREWIGRTAAVAALSGFALPAIVVALSLAVLALNTPALSPLYQTLPLLVVGYVVHFGSQALAPNEQAVRAVSRPVMDSARLLEPNWWRRLARVELPLMRPGLLAGTGLVVLAVIKELPITLLLSPIGFRTLSTEVWASYEEGFLADAAIASLLLLAVSGLLSWLLVLRDRDGTPR